MVLTVAFKSTKPAAMKQKNIFAPTSGLLGILTMAACIFTLVLAFGTHIASAEPVDRAADVRAVRHARDLAPRDEHVHVLNPTEPVTIPITTIYSVSTPEAVFVTSPTSEDAECTPSIVTEYVTVTVKPSDGGQSSDTEVKTFTYSTVTEFATDVQTLTSLVTTDVVVTVTEPQGATPTTKESGKDGMSFSASSETPIDTTTTYITITDGEPVTSTTVVVVPESTPGSSSINATVTVYPPGADPGTQPPPAATPGDSPIIVSAATDGRAWEGVLGIGCTALAVALVMLTL